MNNEVAKCMLFSYTLIEHSWNKPHVPGTKLGAKLQRRKRRSPPSAACKRSGEADTLHVGLNDMQTAALPARASEVERAWTGRGNKGGDAGPSTGQGLSKLELGKHRAAQVRLERAFPRGMMGRKVSARVPLLL